ncbi:Lsr2 family DNA-binding protein [Nocardioides ungokensis]|uniref:Lsr2 family DNA-binding protein n=1 Tax=Nocardioides ungokensis TaxID=1643322 RepID=UPI0015E054BE|nr:histone-like nucleoid-structuring protein Lsr2 [Nocardioides ungokensis]
MTICDRHHQRGEEVPGTTRRFAIDAFKTTADLCDECYEKEVGPLLEFLRSVTRTTIAKRPARPVNRSRKSKLDSSAVRAWALENSIDVSPRGRIRQDVIDKYQAAQS